MRKCPQATECTWATNLCELRLAPVRLISGESKLLIIGLGTEHMMKEEDKLRLAAGMREG